jgi:hypothetical protein
MGYASLISIRPGAGSAAAGSKTAVLYCGSAFQ